MNFNFDFGSIDMARPGSMKPADGPLYAAVNGRAASLSNNECVFQSAHGGDLEVMTHQVLQAMDQTREFRSLEEHAARVISVIPGMAGQAEAVRRVLGYLVERGLLVSDGGFLSSLTAPQAVSSHASLRTLVIRACDRPAQVQRLLSALQAHSTKFGRKDDIVFIDDSRSAEAVGRHRRLLAEHGAALGVSTRCVDAAQSRVVIERLARAVPEARDTLTFLLQLGQGDGFAGGRGYNLATLLTAGGQMALLDDDYIPQFRRSAHTKPGLELDPWGIWATRFPDDGQRTQEYGEELAEDGFALQAAMVGRTLSEVLAANPDLLPTRQQLRGSTLTKLAHLRGDARIVSTFTGVRGAAFTSDNAWLYRLDDRSRADFWRTRENYLRHTNADSVVSAFERVVARPYGTFTPFVVDNSCLMPATAPLGRGEDGLFSAVGNYLYPESLTLHLPITIGHLQEGRRPRQERGMQPLTPSVNRFLMEWLRNQAQVSRSQDAPDRLQFLSAQLADLAHAPNAVLVAMLSEYLRYVRADVIEHIQQQIVANPDAPVYWLADARAIVEANGKALLANTAPPRLDEWPVDIDANGCAEKLRATCLRLSAIWRDWPALWRVAADMGERLSPGR